MASYLTAQSFHIISMYALQYGCTAVDLVLLAVVCHTHTETYFIRKYSPTYLRDTSAFLLRLNTIYIAASEVLLVDKRVFCHRQEGVACG